MHYVTVPRLAPGGFYGPRIWPRIRAVHLSAHLAAPAVPNRIAVLRCAVFHARKFRMGNYFSTMGWPPPAGSGPRPRQPREPSMEPSRSLGWPILLGVVLIVSLVALTVGWVLVSIAAALGWGNAAFYWAVLGVGVALLVTVLAGVIVYFALSVKAIALSQRQSNFIDSVTHELKSPLASLKLYLQTLTRRSVPVERQEEFHRFMLQDVERLDGLIDHLLDAARTLNRRPAATDDVTTIAPLLEQVRSMVLQRHAVKEESVQIECDPELKVRGREADIEIVFRNLLDNAVKYSLPEPRVEVTAAVERSTVTVRVADNGPGIPLSQRHAVFRRFVRLGSELERSTPGTGLGLFLVRSLVKQLRGKVTAKGRLTGQGSVFEVELPAAG